MDLTIEVMLPPRGEDWVERNGRYRVLSPVDVYIPRKAVDVVGMPVTGYIHVRGFPDNHPSFKRLNAEEREARLSGVLCAQWVESSAISAAPDQVMRERRKWVGSAQALPEEARALLLAQRQVTITWGQFKAMMRDASRGGAALRDEDI